MKINISNLHIPHKSRSCFSKSGNPLSVYNSFSEAQKSADYQLRQSAIHLTVYQCNACGKFHLKPTEYYCEKVFSNCSCVDHKGKPKAAYKTIQDAKKMINIRKQAGVTLYAYKCSRGNVWHLTSSR